MRRIDPVERHLLLQGILMKYGYDFRQYAESSINRRLDAILTREGLSTTLDLLKPILSDREFFHRVLPQFTIGTTEFFRDPQFFRGLKEKVFPILHTYPSINIWIAGCSTGEELYSLAILLKEDKLLRRSNIFATDINPEALAKARSGIFDLGSVQMFTKNYLAAGGQETPSEYYTADYGLARFQPELREHVTFTEHNLATDGVFKEMHLILCRNVMIYFKRELQDRVFGLFTQSLGYRGFLGIGSKESLRFSRVHESYEGVDTSVNLYRLRSDARIGGMP